MKRDYETALKFLETRRRQARPENRNNSSAPSHQHWTIGKHCLPDYRGIPSLTGMREWLQILGHSASDLDKLNVVHVAGTKGKGSTCAFVRSFLRAHSVRTGFPNKVGLYTSPDLTCIRERIQINDAPITEDTFSKYFFEVWNGLSSRNAKDSEPESPLPRFLQLLALVAFHTYIREGTEAVVLETHHGGEYDATNFIQKPVATGITTIGLDHVAQLGPTLESIAWHKAGIFKPGAPAFSSPQDRSVVNILRNRAVEKKVTLEFTEPGNWVLGKSQSLQSPVQKVNCALALALAETFLKRVAPPELQNLSADDVARGITNFRWPGRFDIVVEGNMQWFLDGAHNKLSMAEVAEWFAANAQKIENDSSSSTCVLIFSHFSESRDGAALLQCLAESLTTYGKPPDYVIFTTYQERRDGTVRIDKTLKAPEHPFPDLLSTYSHIWSNMFPATHISREQSIEGALARARNIAAENNAACILVTGSLHLVGGALYLLRGH